MCGRTCNLPPSRDFYFDHPAHPGQTTLIHPQPDGVWRMDWQVGPDVDVEHERSAECMDRAHPGPDRRRALRDRLAERLPLPPAPAAALHRRAGVLPGRRRPPGGPFGARGLNSAVQDVDNLAWKLALVLQGQRSRDAARELPDRALAGPAAQPAGDGCHHALHGPA